MTLDPFLLDILVDPEDKMALWYLPDEAVLYNPRLRRSYPVRDGIPVMLVEEASEVDEERAGAYARASYRVTGTPEAR